MKQLINKKIKPQPIVKRAVKDREPNLNYERRSKTVCLTISLVLLISLNFACQPNQSILNSGKAANSVNSVNNSNTAERPRDTFESALRGVQKSGFSYIFVIRRKDGGQFTKEDKTYVRENSPPETNQFILTDEDRAVIAASNFPTLVESVEVWRKVFSVEDLSPAKDANVNGDANAASNTNSNK